MEGYLLPADVLSEIYGLLQASADLYAQTNLPQPAEHARYIAFQLLNAPYIEDVS